VLIEGTPQGSEEPVVLTGTRRLSRLIASPHYDQSYLEDDIETRMWTDALGSTLATNYRVIDQVGGIVLLEANQ